MTDELQHITVEQDMEVYDALPPALRRFLDTGPVGLDATTTREFYDTKLEALTPMYSAGEVQQMVIETLKKYMAQAEGVKDFRKVEVIPERRKLKRPEKKFRVPKRLRSVHDGK